MRVSIIAAHDFHKVIGFEGKIPWYIPADLQRFKDLTLGNAVIMGRKTFQSIGRPLSGRLNIVLTSNRSWFEREYGGYGWFKPDRVAVADSYEDALLIAQLQGYQHVFAIGGHEIYSSAIKDADDMYITLVHGHYQGDAFFPEYSCRRWDIKTIVEVDGNENEETPDYAFYYLERRRGFIEKVLGFLKGQSNQLGPK